jgi:hypothetical protein
MFKTDDDLSVFSAHMMVFGTTTRKNLGASGRRQPV